MKQTIKKAILRVGRPLWKRLSPKFYARIDRRIDLRLAQTDAGWKQHVPAFLNAVSSVQAFGRELARATKAQHDETAQVREALQGQVSLLSESLQGQGLLLREQREELFRLRASIAEAQERLAKALGSAESARGEAIFQPTSQHITAGEEHSAIGTRILNPIQPAHIG